MVEENQMGLKLNGTHQLLAYADDMSLLRDNINTINKNREALIDDGKEVGQEAKVEETELHLSSRLLPDSLNIGIYKTLAVDQSV
jgi:hypothetical protein